MTKYRTITTTPLEEFEKSSTKAPEHDDQQAAGGNACVREKLSRSCSRFLHIAKTVLAAAFMTS